MPVSITTFPHQPLQDASKQIRLLHFTGDTNGGATITCELATVNISECPPYAAISYTWGSPLDPFTIAINGHEVEVNQNCHYALTQIWPYLNAGLGYFWLDSICINQSDLDEKALQVEMMADIYARARTVLSCVGSHADDSEIVLPIVKRLASWAREQPEGSRYNQSVALDYLNEQLSIDGKYDLDAGTRFNHAYTAFGDRQYWQRMWIVQEVRLGSQCTLFCGPDTIDLADFATFLRAFMNDQAADKEIWLTIWLMTDMWRVIAGSCHLPKKAEAHGNVRPLEISKALDRFNKHMTTDFRDRLYALAKIAEWPDGLPPPKPDYRVSKIALVKQVLQRLSSVDWDTHRCCTGIDSLVSGFDLAIPEPEMQAFLQEKRQGACVTSSESKPFLYAGTFLRQPGGVRIRLAQDGHLTANIHNANKNWKLGTDKSRIFVSSVGRPLYVDDEVAGYLCPQAEANDILLQIDDGNGVPIWLVIRDSPSPDDESSVAQRFDIIGPALANPGFSVHSTERTGYTDMYDHSGIPEEQRNVSSVFDLWFDQDEFLVWKAWVYSFEKRKLQQEDVERFLEGEGQWMRRSWAVLREDGTDWQMQ